MTSHNIEEDMVSPLIIIECRYSKKVKTYSEVLTVYEYTNHTAWVEEFNKISFNENYNKKVDYKYKYVAYKDCKLKAACFSNSSYLLDKFSERNFYM